jgi:hypothetical protein
VLESLHRFRAEQVVVLPSVDEVVLGREDGEGEEGEEEDEGLAESCGIAAAGAPGMGG